LPDAKGYFPPAVPNRTVRRRPLFILPSGQGRCGLDAARLTGQAFHRARYALTSDAIQRVQASHGRHAQRSSIISQQQTSMSYIEAFEQELIAKLNGKEDEASVVRWVSEKVLESYRNGITAGQKGATVKRKGQSRRRGFGQEQEAD
jgi:hypothetical protein